MQDAISAAQNWLIAHEQELIESTRAMLRIPSIEADALPNAPFGQANRDALDLALSMSRDWGFSSVTDLEGFGGFAEIGSGDKMVITLGHLDVVPVGPGWKHEPFGAEIDGDYIYARGATDDKGPTMASFYAIRAIQQAGIELPCRLRIFFGCNEESGFKCVERYAQTEEVPTLGVAPDSGWPCYHAEKGISNAVIRVPLNSGDFRLLHAEGGSRPNIVIDETAARVFVGSSARKHVEEKLADSWDANVHFQWEGDELAIKCQGKAAHGATPFSGDSAATRLFRFLEQIAPVPDRGYFDALLFASHPSGVGLGIHGNDEPSGDLTSNLGVLRTVDGALELTVNVRRPVTWAKDALREKFDKFLATKDGWSMASFTASEPLYFPLDHILTRTIVDVYEAETGERKAPGVMGGGTYARALPNCVSIGTGWEGDGEAHQTDERIKAAHLLKMSKIYAHLFVRLCHEAVKL
jgi:succinyl-diaminopimelate desuccinylase